jgi:NTE family protein
MKTNEHTEMGTQLLDSAPKNYPRIGLCLSGGGLRAIAFQFGVLKALYKNSLLDKVKVISAVSGGSILAGMYAYHEGSFEDFEKQVMELLRKGIASSLFRRVFFSFRAIFSFATLIIYGTYAVFSDIMRSILLFINRRFRKSSYNNTPEFLFNIRPPFRRWSTRTSILEDILRDKLFGNKVLSDARINNIDVVFNATDLLTSKPFHFGSSKSGNDILGSVKDNNIDIAHAVAASSAHPIFFPAVDKAYSFISEDNSVERIKVLLSDGGIIDNLGITSFMSNGMQRENYINCDVNYIICATAVQGYKRSVPYWLIPRLMRASETINRRLLEFEHDNLKRSLANDEIEGFMLLCLAEGTNEKIQNYPTNFYAMKQSDIDLIVVRGEKMTEDYLEKCQILKRR